MARKLRVESPGGIYHVLNRGGAGRPLFRTEKAKAIFLKCLGEACEKTGWRVHAWCLTANGYHLALETPEANLVEGMLWLQSAFSARVNPLRPTGGRLFKDRYKSLLVDPKAGLGSLCHYLHLNATEAEVRPVAKLPTWPWSSLAQLMAPALRPAWYTPLAALDHAGGQKDTPAGRKKYFAYLSSLAANPEARENQRFSKMSKGWLIGSAKFAEKMRQQHGAAVGKGRKLAKTRQVEQAAAWQQTLALLLRKLGRTTKDLTQSRKSADWKLAVAAALKAQSTVTNRWLGTTLNMGNLHEVSRKVAAWQRAPDPALTRKLS